jgi:hypothetical protein
MRDVEQRLTCEPISVVVLAAETYGTEKPTRARVETVRRA